MTTKTAHQTLILKFLFKPRSVYVRQNVFIGFRDHVPLEWRVQERPVLSSLFDFL
jgi:hypothetical protein